MPVIYCDGESETVTKTEGEILRVAGLLEWYPGSDEDYILSSRVGWGRVRAVLDRLRES